MNARRSQQPNDEMVAYERIRDEDAAAFARMKGKMTVVSLSADEQGKWQAIFKQVRQRLAQGTYPADVVAKLEALAK